jgi:hypothetical protein
MENPAGDKTVKSQKSKIKSQKSGVKGLHLALPL